MAAATPPVLAKLKEIQAYLERRKADAGKDWAECLDFNNRLNDFIDILFYFDQILTTPIPTGHDITYSSKYSNLPPLRSGIWIGLLSNEYRNLRHELQQLITPDFTKALDNFRTYLAHLRSPGKPHPKDNLKALICKKLQEKTTAKPARLDWSVTGQTPASTYIFDAT